MYSFGPCTFAHCLAAVCCDIYALFSVEHLASQIAPICLAFFGLPSFPALRWPFPLPPGPPLARTSSPSPIQSSAIQCRTATFSQPPHPTLLLPTNRPYFRDFPRPGGIGSGGRIPVSLPAGLRDYDTRTQLTASVSRSRHQGPSRHLQVRPACPPLAVPARQARIPADPLAPPLASAPRRLRAFTQTIRRRRRHFTPLGIHQGSFGLPGDTLTSNLKLRHRRPPILDRNPHRAHLARP